MSEKGENSPVSRPWESRFVVARIFVRFASNAPIRAEYAERMVAYDVDEIPEGTFEAPASLTAAPASPATVNSPSPKIM